MSQRYTFHVTKHCVRRIFERGLSLNSLKDVVHYSDDSKKLNHGCHGGVIKKFQKIVNNRTLVVVAEVRNDECWLMTAYEV